MCRDTFHDPRRSSFSSVLSFINSFVRTFQCVIYLFIVLLAVFRCGYWTVEFLCRVFVGWTRGNVFFFLKKSVAAPIKSPTSLAFVARESKRSDKIRDKGEHSFPNWMLFIHYWGWADVKLKTRKSDAREGPCAAASDPSIAALSQLITRSRLTN